jgi:hypothetical protein
VLIDINAQRSATSAIPVVTGRQASPVLLPEPHAARLHATLVSLSGYGFDATGAGSFSGKGRISGPGTALSSVETVSPKQQRPAAGVPPRGSTG